MLKFTLVLGLAFAAAVLAAPAASSQDMVLNGNFELQARPPWALTGSNQGAGMAQFDVDGDGTDSWCWKREPGSDGGNGGLTQQILLIAGVTYDVECSVCYYTC